MIFAIESLGEPQYLSPLGLSNTFGDDHCNYVSDEQKLQYNVFQLDGMLDSDQIPNYNDLAFEVAGPREKLFFDPQKTTCAIVTCGGLCPGINNVIRSVVMELFYRYGVRKILGIRYGYAGLNPKIGHELLMLTPETAGHIHHWGGTILGSSRGNQDPALMADELEKLGVNILFCVGGDGTQRGAHEICTVLKRRGKKIAVVGIPKTIDNDILHIEKSFGFETAFSKACEAIEAAHVEAIGAWNGIGIVKLMGRHSGFIAASAALAVSEVNFVLIPELPFDLKGQNGFLQALQNRLEKRHHAVVVIAEGAAQEYFSSASGYDLSGNKVLNDSGLFIKSQISAYMQAHNIPVTIKYIDPSYIIRSVPAIPSDALFCQNLGQNAVHAGMAGKTDLLVGWRSNAFIHVPLDAIINKRKTINIESPFWLSVLAATGQPQSMVHSPRLF
ncbi:ATP-dependent 6-phosphofructokinase [bacterium]|nr:ATP-dependent 6-phosphofructokinase [bacterium]